MTLHSWAQQSAPLLCSTCSWSFFGGYELDIENFVALVLAVAVGLYMLYCLFRPEDL